MDGYLRMTTSVCRGFRRLPKFPAPPQWKLLRRGMGGDGVEGKAEELGMAGYLKVTASGCHGFRRIPAFLVSP